VAAAPGLVMADLENVGHALWLRKSAALWPAPLALGLVGGFAALRRRPRWFERCLPSSAIYRVGVALGRNARFAAAVAGALRRQREARQARRDPGEEPVAPPEPGTLTGLSATLAVFPRLPDEQTARTCLTELAPRPGWAR